MGMNERSILVTGGAGYIGSHTIIELLAKWPGDIISMDHFGNSSPAVFDRIKGITGKQVRNHAVDLCDRDALRRALDLEPGIAGVIHFAAYKSVPESVADPHKYYHNNIASLLNILAECRQRGIDHFIFSSSCSVYGNIATMPVNEDTVLGAAESPYAYTKQIGERIVADHIRTQPSLRAISLRYFNPAGAHTTGLNGEDPINPPSSLVPVITRTASGRRPVMHVHGSDYDTRDGSCIRDYVHVSDIADAHIAALERTFGATMGAPHEIINLGTGNGVSVLEAIAAFEKVSGQKLNYEMGPRRAGDVEAVWSDTGRSRTLLGWEAKRSLEEMMRSAWAWERHCLEVNR